MSLICNSVIQRWVFFRSHMLLARAIAIFVLAWGSSAFGIELPKRHLQFVDPSGNEIETYCVVSLYAKGYGIGFGPEESGRKSYPERHLLWPVSIGKKDGFDKMRRTREQGVAIGTFVITFGESVGVTASLVLKRGFLPFLWNKYYDNSYVTTIPMKLGDSDSLVKNLISEKPSQEMLREAFQLKSDVSVVVGYSDSDRKELEDCYFLNKGSE